MNVEKKIINIEINWKLILELQNSFTHLNNFYEENIRIKNFCEKDSFEYIRIFFPKVIFQEDQEDIERELFLALLLTIDPSINAHKNFISFENTEISRFNLEISRSNSKVILKKHHYIVLKQIPIDSLFYAIELFHNRQEQQAEKFQLDKKERKKQKIRMQRLDSRFHVNLISIDLKKLDDCFEFLWPKIGRDLKSKNSGKNLKAYLFSNCCEDQIDELTEEEQEEQEEHEEKITNKKKNKENAGILLFHSPGQKFVSCQFTLIEKEASDFFEKWREFHLHDLNISYRYDKNVTNRILIQKFLVCFARKCDPTVFYLFKILQLNLLLQFPEEKFTEKMFFLKQLENQRDFICLPNFSYVSSSKEEDKIILLGLSILFYKKVLQSMPTLSLLKMDDFQKEFDEEFFSNFKLTFSYKEFTQALYFTHGKLQQHLQEFFLKGYKTIEHSKTFQEKNLQIKEKFCWIVDAKIEEIYSSNLTSDKKKKVLVYQYEIVFHPSVYKKLFITSNLFHLNQYKEFIELLEKRNKRKTSQAIFWYFLLQRQKKVSSIENSYSPIFLEEILGTTVKKPPSFIKKQLLGFCTILDVYLDLHPARQTDFSLKIPQEKEEFISKFLQNKVFYLKDYYHYSILHLPDTLE